MLPGVSNKIKEGPLASLQAVIVALGASNILH
jgi:hypothetical protein